MSARLNVVDGPAPTVCRHLRAKTPFSTLEELGRPWEHGDASNASYWCLCTMDAAGPDDGVAHARDCRAGRACFE
jgi:hypothetical protein